MHETKVNQIFLLKFVYSEKATQFCEISTLLLSTVHTDKSKVEISQNFVAFSEYMNFIVLTGPNNQFQYCEFYDRLEQFYRLDF